MFPHLQMNAHTEVCVCEYVDMGEGRERERGAAML